MWPCEHLVFQSIIFILSQIVFFLILFVKSDEKTPSVGPLEHQQHFFSPIMFHLNNKPFSLPEHSLGRITLKTKVLQKSVFKERSGMNSWAIFRRRCLLTMHIEAWQTYSTIAQNVFFKSSLFLKLLISISDPELDVVLHRFCQPTILSYLY